MAEKQCNLIFGGGMKEVIDLIYPVGQTIIRDHNPQTDYPWQTWEQDCVDRFPVGAGNKYALDQTGGEETHTLSVNEMPSHNHITNITGYVFTSTENFIANDYNGDSLLFQDDKGGGTTKPFTGQNYTSNNTGGSKPHNNMPPYKGVYFWTRTA